MGGSGGGGYPVSPSPAKPEQSDGARCRAITFTTVLQPEPHGPVHQKGAVFEIVPTPVGAGTVFVAVDGSGKAVGTIVERTDSLQRCTDLGISYLAEVEEVFLGAHTVRVRATPDGGP